MKKIAPGTLAGLVAAALLAAPALAGRRSRCGGGRRATLLERTAVTPTGHRSSAAATCAGDSALTRSTCDRRQLGGTTPVPSIRRARSSASRTRSRRAVLVALGQRRSTRRAASAACRSRAATRCCSSPTAGPPDFPSTACPLRLTRRPRQAAPGVAVTVKVVQLDGDRRQRPVAGATVRVGGATATTGATARAAHLRQTGPGPRQGEQGRARPLRAATACVTRRPTARAARRARRARRARPRDTTAPIATIAGLTRPVRPGAAPRELRGTVTADPSGMRRSGSRSRASAAGAAGRSTARASASSAIAAAAGARSASATARSGPTCCPQAARQGALHHPRGGDRQGRQRRRDRDEDPRAMRRACCSRSRPCCGARRPGRPRARRRRHGRRQARRARRPADGHAEGAHRRGRRPALRGRRARRRSPRSPRRGCR